MIISTYNIWNANTNFDKRLELLVNEISDKNIDVLGLQEVKDMKTYNYIKDKTGFSYGFYFEGLAILSDFEIKKYETYSEDNNYMLRVVYNDTSFTNVHFDWMKKENRMKGLNAYFDLLDKNALDNEFILGDFNDIADENLHFELIISDYIDLHREYSHTVNELPLATLDIHNNPRWRNIKTDEVPKRFDWIMLNTIREYTLKSVSLIGTKENNEITPSDHYGVMADIDISL